MSEASPGRILRTAREKQGLHIAALAAAIKVAPRKLDALENDRWEDLPDATFTRALAQTVCRTLKLDPRPVLDLLPAPAASLEHAHAGLNAPFRRGRDVPGTTPSAVRPMVWAGLALMLAAVAVYLLPDGVFQSRPRSAAPAEATGTAASAPIWAEAASAAATVADGASAAATAAVVAGQAPVVSVDASTPAVAASSAVAAVAATAMPAPTSPAPAASAVTATPPAADGAAAIVQLRTTQPSWIEVRDARGAVLLSRLVQPGEAVGFDRGLPLRLTVGNVRATELVLRGQPVDLAARARDNVARFELQ